MRRALLALGGLAGLSVAQQAGKDEDGPQVLVHWCDADGSCEAEEGAFTIDASWRVQHNASSGGWQSCIIQDGMWQSRLCPDPLTCGKKCAVDGMSLDDYADVHGITELENGIRMNYVTATKYGVNIGSRMYLLDDYYKDYKIFKLKNREFAFDIDVGSLPCGVNAAVYLVNMEKDGGKGKGNNKAGAKFGTGYCDAHCPHSSNFIDGQANMDWSHGTCCPEVDLFEGNSEAQAFTVHTCETAGYVKCEHVDCGDADKGHQYEGICDKDGCDFNPYRMGSKDFWGHRGTVGTDKVVTVITQFITTDGTDDGDLKEIRRIYMQGGRVIQNAQSAIEGVKGDSLTDKYCGANKYQFKDTRSPDNPNGDFDQFGKFGGMEKIGQALDKGMVLAVSLWDDPGSNMRWLDSVSPHNKPDAKGAKRGPCDPDGKAIHERRMHQLAYVKFENFMYGKIGSILKSKSDTRLRRRFEQRRVRAGAAGRELRRPLPLALIAGGASLGLLALLSAAWSRARRGRRESAQDAADDAVAPLALHFEEPQDAS
mmetsp:Transcript_84517/g.247893  ORF Transcript_84517/g.247893 Transcript_84517/m.247893 type:complete len:539 (-) Transcript_84517:147-1763(-)